MKLHPGVRQVLAALTVLLLLALAFQGIVGGATQLPQSSSFGQYVQSFAQLLYGVCAVLSIATAVRWREFASPVQFAFIAGCVVAGGLAAVVWGGESIGSGLVAAVAALAIASALVWMLRAAVIPLAKKEL
jgi:hypothetical protein